MTEKNPNPEDREETEYLEQVKEAVQQKIVKLSSKVSDYDKNISEHKKYIWENIYDMDMVEKSGNVEILSEEENSLNRTKSELESLRRFIKSPYFGRIDFSFDDEPEDTTEKFYIGIRGFSTEDATDILVYDWRAPISGMFYNYDEGPASYEAPQGIYKGIIRRKKQYKIEDGKLVFQIHSSLKIDDEILQNVLSRSADTKMRNIVSTIQRDQNKIIRNKEYPVLVVQGVAGSGKTSIALHRIAYLLYTFRKELKSEQMLIVSPNHIFSEYISNILPELGESRIKEMSFYNMVHKELKNFCTVESLIDYNERLLSNNNTAALDYKLSAEFFGDIQSFFKNFTDEYVKFENVSAEGFKITGDYIKTRFENQIISKLPYFQRLEKIVEKFVDDVELSKNINIGARYRRMLLDKVKKTCLKTDNLLNIYNDFLKAVTKKRGIDLGIADKKNLKTEDALPLVYFKFELFGYTSFESIKHVVIDEMQDYSYIHFEILKRIFNCRMTILGDKNQVIKRADSSVTDVLKTVFKNAHITEIKKSYRSTYEITSFATNLIGLKNIEIFNRHGQEPEIISCTSQKSQAEQIEKICRDEGNRSANITTAIICKSAAGAESMYGSLKGRLKKLNLCVKENGKLENGITVITSYLSKGLEFDSVIIPDVDEKNYNNDVDRQLLYISCTRALHRLYLLHVGKCSSIIKKKAESSGSEK